MRDIERRDAVDECFVLKENDRSVLRMFQFRSSRSALPGEGGGGFGGFEVSKVLMEF